MKNQIYIIKPYKFNNTWVFDDSELELIREPFVAGTPEMIDTLVESVDNSDEGFKLLFSIQPFPGYQAELTWIREEYEGNWYSWQSKNIEGWLCPALLLYFSEAPQQIYCKAESISTSVP
ncbi:MAG: DUF6717 family protein [Waterburya sp.]